MKVYEGMFLMDPALTSDWQAAEAEIQRVLTRAEAKVHGIKNWDERRLAYPIKKQKRGLYALSYFEVTPDKLTALERDVQLSETCLRALFLRREAMTPEEITAALEAEPPKLVSRYDDRGPGGFGGPGGPGGYGGRPDRGGRFDGRGGSDSDDSGPDITADLDSDD